jgi:replicative DNA helicase
MADLDEVMGGNALVGDVLAAADAGAEAEAAKTRAEQEASLKPWSVMAAWERLEAKWAREESEGGIRWPGCESGWPEWGSRGGLDLLDSDRGHPGPWRQLWRMTGPPRSDWLAVLVGPTGRGKSGWALTAAEAAATGGAPVLIMSCEMGADELLARLISLRAPMPAPAWRDIHRGAVDPYAALRAVEALDKAAPNLYLWAPAKADRTPKALAEKVKTLAAVTGKTPFVVLDYVQRLADGEERRLAVSDLSGDLRTMTRPEGDYPGCALLVLSSTARDNYRIFQAPDDLLRAHKGGYKRKGETKNGSGRFEYVPPVPLEGLGKESGELEYDAPVVLCLTCDTDTAPPKTREAGPGRLGVLVVAKNRAGETGWASMWFEGATGRWLELEDDSHLARRIDNSDSPKASKSRTKQVDWDDR